MNRLRNKNGFLQSDVLIETKVLNVNKIDKEKKNKNKNKKKKKENNEIKKETSEREKLENDVNEILRM